MQTVTELERELGERYLARARTAESEAERTFWTRLGERWLELSAADPAKKCGRRADGD
jgi:hypothetical protein